jgi:hypothetical protein
MHFLCCLGKPKLRTFKGPLLAAANHRRMKRLSLRLVACIVGVAVVPFLARCSHPVHQSVTKTPQSTSTRLVVGATTPLTDAVPELAPGAPPQLVAVEISSSIFHSGDTVYGAIVASSNVASADIHVEGYSMPLNHDSEGHFSLTRTLPHIPSFAKGDYTLVVAVHNTAGQTVQTSMPIHLR